MDRFCAGCGRTLAASPPPVPAALPRPGTPSTVTAARVMLGLSVVGDALAVLVAIVGWIVVTAVQKNLTDPTDVTSTAEGNHVLTGLLVMGLFSAAAVGTTLWSLPAIGRGDPGARVLVTAIQLIDVVASGIAVGLFDAGAGQAVVAVVFSVPFTGVMLGLLWFPEASKRHFGDQPALASIPRQAGPRSSVAGPFEPPTVPFAASPKPGRPMRPVLVTAIAAAGVVAVILVVLGLSVSASGSALEKQAEGTWSCQALGDEDQDVYGDVNQAPFTVVIGDGTFSIPSRYLAGTWSVSTSGLSIESTWSKVSSRPRSTVQIGGIPTSAAQSSGSSAATYRTPTYPTPFGRTLEWSWSGGRFHVQGGTSIATTGVDCAKQSNDTTTS